MQPSNELHIAPGSQPRTPAAASASLHLCGAPCRSVNAAFRYVRAASVIARRPHRAAGARPPVPESSPAPYQRAPQEITGLLAIGAGGGDFREDGHDLLLQRAFQEKARHPGAPLVQPAKVSDFFTLGCGKRWHIPGKFRYIYALTGDYGCLWFLAQVLLYVSRARTISRARMKALAIPH